MLLSGTMTCFTMNAAVNILCFQIFNILMAFKTGLLSGIMNLQPALSSREAPPVMTILPKGIRYKKMSGNQKKCDKYCKDKCQPWNLWWNMASLEQGVSFQISKTNLAPKFRIPLITAFQNMIFIHIPEQYL